MGDLITLTCPSCGGTLEVTNEADRFVCVHCGNAHVIDPGTRVESLANEVEVLRAESLIRRLSEEIRQLQQKRQALSDRIAEDRLPVNMANMIRFFIGFIMLLTGIGFAFGIVLQPNPSAGWVPLALLVAILLIVSGVAVVRSRPLVYKSNGGLVKELIATERQIAQKQREVEKYRRSLSIPAATGESQLVSDMRDAPHAT